MLLSLNSLLTCSYPWKSRASREEERRERERKERGRAKKREIGRGCQQHGFHISSDKVDEI